MTRLNQRDVLVEGPSLWSLTDRLCHGILQMGYIGPQVLCEVGVSCQRWGRRYDHVLVSCLWVCRAFSQRKRDKQIDYAPLMAKDGAKLREHFDACVKQHLMMTHCDTTVASASLERLTNCVAMAAQETLCVKNRQTVRKRCKATV